MSDESDRPTPAPDDWLGSGTILFIDDDEAIREVGGRMIELMGFEPLLADSGLAGLDALQDHRDDVSLVLLDLNMPGMNGIETLQRIHAMAADMKVLLTSGHGGESLEDLGQYGAVGFLRKPFRMNDLRKALQSALDEG